VRQRDGCPKVRPRERSARWRRGLTPERLHRTPDAPDAERRGRRRCRRAGATMRSMPGRPSLRRPAPAVDAGPPQSSTDHRSRQYGVRRRTEPEARRGIDHRGTSRGRRRTSHVAVSGANVGEGSCSTSRRILSSPPRRGRTPTDRSPSGLRQHAHRAPLPRRLRDVREERLSGRTASPTAPTAGRPRPPAASR
jgi:hypothetical protein